MTAIGTVLRDARNMYFFYIYQKYNYYLKSFTMNLLMYSSKSNFGSITTSKINSGLLI